MIQVLSEKEAAALLTYTDKITLRDGLIIRLMLQCGLRVGEVVNLNIEDVMKGGEPVKALYLRAATTKGKKARYVDMPGQVQRIVRAYIGKRAARPDELIGPAALFESFRAGNRLQVRDVQRMVSRVSVSAIGRRIHPHTLRHTYATMLMRVTSMRVVQELLGHASISTTQIYTHPTTEDRRKAVEKAFT